MRSRSSRISGTRRRLEARERQQLADVHALVAHPLDAHDHVQQRGDEAQVAGDGAWRASSERMPWWVSR